MFVQVADGVHRLSGGVTNIYLIEEGGKYTVVDAGTPNNSDGGSAARVLTQTWSTQGPQSVNKLTL